jgi:hypothetical protein
MTLRDAKDLHGDITKLLLTLESVRNSASREETVTVEMSGGGFKST